MVGINPIISRHALKIENAGFGSPLMTAF